jgi:hypothetical protein
MIFLGGSCTFEFVLEGVRIKEETRILKCVAIFALLYYVVFVFDVEN